MWSDVYRQIVERLKSQLLTLQNGGQKVFEAVYVGSKYAPLTYPVAYILPVTVRCTPASPNRTKFDMTLDVHVISREPSTEAGIMDVAERLGKVESMLVSDRSFGSLVENLEVERIDLAVERPTTRDRHEGRLRVRFEKWLVG